MLINLSELLTSEGKKTSMEVPLEMTGFDSRLGSFPIEEKSAVSLSLANVEAGRVNLSGKVSLVFRAECDRCLSPLSVPLDLQFEREIISPDAAADGEADDQGFMDGYQLDVETLVYNEIMGNWPAKILCKEDCKGICPKCGQNLNMGDCGCDTFVPDPRMAVIQDIFNANKEV